ncbi:hypothetical protein JCM14469_35700 [Desulfatiferula olefinivorans]
MDQQNRQTLMDQRIFTLGLPVETVSVYLLCTGLADADRPLTIDTLRSAWNGSDDVLLEALSVLGEKSIVTVSDHTSGEYRVQPSRRWC